MCDRTTERTTERTVAYSTAYTQVNFFGTLVNMIVFDYEHYSQNPSHEIGLDIISKCLCSSDACWEPYQTEITKEILKDGGVFIDVGGHLGYYSLLASSLCDHVYTIEGNPDFHRLIQRNIELNSIENVTPICVFVDETFTIESVVDEDEQVRLVKCDIEGNEIQFVKAIRKKLENKTIENLILEISPKLKDGYPECVMSILELGYIAYDIGLSPQRKLESTTLDSLAERRISFETIHEAREYINSLESDQSNFLFTIK